MVSIDHVEVGSHQNNRKSSLRYLALGRAVFGPPAPIVLRLRSDGVFLKTITRFPTLRHTINTDVFIIRRHGA